VHLHLEEELIAMLRPGAKRPTRIDQQEARKVSDEQKDEARERVLKKLIAHGPIKGTWEEIRAELGLADMSMTLFKRSCWHLKVGDRDESGRPLIKVIYSNESERGGWERPPLLISAR
jgi:hypothetical protein